MSSSSTMPLTAVSTQTAQGWAAWCVRVLLASTCAHMAELPHDMWAQLATDLNTCDVSTPSSRHAAYVRFQDSCAQAHIVCPACTGEQTLCVRHGALELLSINAEACIHFDFDDTGQAYAHQAATQFCEMFSVAPTRDGITIVLATLNSWRDPVEAAYESADAVLAAKTT